MIKENENRSSQIEYTLYVKRDFVTAFKQFDFLFREFISIQPVIKKMGKKHKCNRDEKCLCIYLGKLLIDSQVNNSTEELKTKFETYYYNPSINLPVTLLKYLTKAYIKALDLISVRALLDTYLTYSKLSTTEDKSKGAFFEIDIKSYEDLNYILIFDCILIKDGFIKARSRINSIADESVKQKFMDKYDELVFIYTKEKQRSISNKLLVDTDEIKTSRYDPAVYNNIINVIDNKAIKDFTLMPYPFSNFKIENSLLQRVISALVNRNFLRFSALVLILYSVYKLIKKYNININPQYFEKFRFFTNLAQGLFKLLVNY